MARFFRSFPKSRFPQVPMAIRFPAVVGTVVNAIKMLMGMGM